MVDFAPDDSGDLTTGLLLVSGSGIARWPFGDHA